MYTLLSVGILGHDFTHIKQSPLRVDFFVNHSTVRCKIATDKVALYGWF